MSNYENSQKEPASISHEMQEQDLKSLIASIIEQMPEGADFYERELFPYPQRVQLHPHIEREVQADCRRIYRQY